MPDMFRPAATQAELDAEAAAREGADALKAPIANPIFTGTVTLPGDPGAALVAAPKQYIDASFAAVPNELQLLDDVDVAAANDGEALVWDQISLMWIPAAVAPPREEVMVPSGALASILGAAPLAGAGSLYTAWFLDDASTERIGGLVPASSFAGWTTFDVVLRAVNVTAGIGNVVWQLTRSSIAPAGTANAFTTSAKVTAATGAQHITQEVVLASDLAVPIAGNELQFSIDRVGADVADTKVGDMGLRAVYFRRAS